MGRPLADAEGGVGWSIKYNAPHSANEWAHVRVHQLNQDQLNGNIAKPLHMADVCAGCRCGFGMLNLACAIATNARERKPMNTPNLDKLMEQMTQGDGVVGIDAAYRCRAIFTKHGPAMVAVLKAVTRSGHHAGCEWYSQLPQCTCGVARVAQLLTQLDLDAQ